MRLVEFIVIRFLAVVSFSHTSSNRNEHVSFCAKAKWDDPRPKAKQNKDIVHKFTCLGLLAMVSMYSKDDIANGMLITQNKHKRKEPNWSLWRWSMGWIERWRKTTISNVGHVLSDHHGHYMYIYSPPSSYIFVFLLLTLYEAAQALAKLI